MKKITINVNNRTLTIYVAGNAFPADLPAAAQESILKTIAERMYLKFNDNEIVYLAQVELPTAKTPDKIKIAYNSLGNKEDRLLISTVTMTPGENPPPILIEDMATLDVSYSLPSDIESAEYRRVLLNKAVTNARVVDDQVLYLTQDPVKVLQGLKDEVFANIPPSYPNFAGLHEFVDGTIHQQADTINKDRKYIQDVIQAAQRNEYAYYAAILPLTAHVYNAAKMYYLELLQQYGSNYAELRKQFAAFNILFKGFVHVNEDFSISSPNQTMEQLRTLDADTLQQNISTLVHDAYQQSKMNNAFKFLQERLSSANEFYAVKGSYIPWTWKFEFTAATKDLYAQFVGAKRDVDNLATDGLKKLVETIHTAKNAILDRASHIKEEHKPAILKHQAELAETAKKAAKQQAKAEAAATRNAQGSFWQRNKGTLISIGVGILAVAGGAVAVTFLLPLTLPVLLIAGGVGLAVRGISAIVGRVIDYRKNKNAKDQYTDVSSAPGERTSLVADSDSDFSQNATTAQLLAQASLGRSSTAATPSKADDFSLPRSRSGSLTSLFAPAEETEEDKQYREMAAFESELVWKIAEAFCGTDQLKQQNLAAVYTEREHNIDNYLEHVREKYPTQYKAAVNYAIKAVAQDHPNLNAKLFQDSLLEKEFNLSRQIGASGKKDFNPFG